MKYVARYWTILAGLILLGLAAFEFQAFVGYAIFAGDIPASPERKHQRTFYTAHAVEALAVMAIFEGLGIAMLLFSILPVTRTAVRAGIALLGGILSVLLTFALFRWL
jgi:hypothetical protein